MTFKKKRKIISIKEGKNFEGARGRLGKMKEKGFPRYFMRGKKD